MELDDCTSMQMNLKWRLLRGRNRSSKIDLKYTPVDAYFSPLRGLPNLTLVAACSLTNHSSPCKSAWKKLLRNQAMLGWSQVQFH